MEHPSGAATSQATGAAYDRFMGRYSRPLSRLFADWAGIHAGQQALDVGAGPGALTAVLLERLGDRAVAACDPSPPFLAALRERHPAVDARQAGAEHLPFADDRFDAALAQLVFHFVADPETAATEMSRVVRPGGIVAACVWDFADGMQLLRYFWDAAVAVDPAAPDEVGLRFGAPGEIADLLRSAGLTDVAETTLEVAVTYASVDELWGTYLEGVGPAGAYCLSLSESHRAAVKAALVRRLGEPMGPVTLRGLARAGKGTVPPA